MSYFRRYAAGITNHGKWVAHVFAFGPEPEVDATWRCPVCKQRRPVSVKRCCR